MLDLCDRAEFRPQDAALLPSMPAQVYDKFPALQPVHNCSLCEHHKGELVEVTSHASRWLQAVGPCPDMPSTGGREDWQSEQFLCYPKPVQAGQRVPKRGRGSNGKGVRGQPLATLPHQRGSKRRRHTYWRPYPNSPN